MAEPMLATALTAFALPKGGNFQLMVNTVHGVSPIPDTEHYYHLGMFGALVDANDVCARPTTTGLTATVDQVAVPTADQLQLRGTGLAWPEVTLAVGATSSATDSSSLSYSYQVDDGFWSEYARASPDGKLRVSHPLLLLQGRHRISVKAREPGARSSSAALSLPVTVDWEPPEASFREDLAGRKLRLRAHDAVDGADAVRVRQRLGDSDWTDGSLDQSWDLDAIDGRELVVELTDTSGNLRRLVRRGTVLEVPGSNAVASAPQAGCSAVSVGGGAWSALPLLLVFARRRRR
jgi:uncharacterized protein (TIGR03382 family)